MGKLVPIGSGYIKLPELHDIIQFSTLFVLRLYQLNNLLSTIMVS